MHALASGVSGAEAIGAVIIVIVGAGLYFIPGFVASVRHVPNSVSVWVINIFLGWSIVGWAVALAMAVRSRPQPAIVQPPSGGWRSPLPPNPSGLPQRDYPQQWGGQP